MEYFVTRNLKHDTTSYVRGDTIKLPESVAASLLEDGVIQAEPIADAEPPKNRDLVGKSAKKEKQSEDVPTVGGEAVETGEPSIDGNPEASTVAQDVTPQVQEPADQLKEAAQNL